MSDNIDMSNGRENIAYLGSRKSVWHRFGNEMLPGKTIDEWAIAAGINWEAVLVNAYADLSEITGTGLTLVPDRRFNARSDNGYILGQMSERYVNVQPREALEFCQRYVEVDPRFQIDVAGSLKCGEIIWVSATFNGPMTIAGDTHVPRLLMSTTFDGSGSTVNQATMTRVVCNNTLNIAHGDRRAQVRTRHSTKFNATAVAKELALMAQGFEVYKQMGDALAQAEMSKQQVADFFKDCLGIAKDAKVEDVSTRKQNQYLELATAYRTTLAEGAEGGWAALQAVTRYVDHDRGTRGGTNEAESRFLSAQFGSGDALKGKAMGLLMPLIKDRVYA